MNQTKPYHILLSNYHSCLVFSDQATEACIDLALLLGLPFAVVPCCVFPSEFPERKLLDGERVRTYNELVNYLCNKHNNIRMTKLPFIETDTAKNTVLYMLKEDLLKC